MVALRRVTKVISEGKRLRFSAMVVVGDKNGSVGVGLGRALDTRGALDKAARQAEKNMHKMQVVGDTIPHEVIAKDGACKVLLRPAKPGTGVIAGSSVRTVLELCGIENVYGKILGASDPIGNTYCTFKALKMLRSARVLSRMDKMKDRIELKVELDKERKKRQDALDKKRKTMDKDNRGGRRGDNRRMKRPSKFDNRQAATAPAPATGAARAEKTEAK